MSYSILVDNLVTLTQNNDPVFLAAVPGFITMAERQIYNQAKLPSTRKNGTGVTVIGSRSLTMPTDYVYGKAISLTTAAGTVNLLPKSAEYLDEMYPLATTQAQPKVYAVYDETTLMLAPTPNLVYTVNIHYFAVPSSIVTASTTWLDTNFPQVLLYCAALHAYTFMKGAADVMAYYQHLYDTSLAEMKETTKNLKLENFR
jgi:hypothetical protein